MKEVFRTEESNAVAVFKFEFNVEEKDKIYRHPCAVTEAIPKLRLACSRRYDGCAGNSRVSFGRFADGNKTRQVTHSGLGTFPPITVFEKENCVVGWTSLIGTELPT